MSEAPKAWSVRQEDGVHVVHLGQAVITRPVVHEIRDAMQKLVESQDRPQIVLDFTEVREVSSAIIGVVVALNKQADAKGGILCLCQVNAMIREIFRLMKLDCVLTLESTLESALARCDAGAQP